jgi:hypothetical protein
MQEYGTTLTISGITATLTVEAKTEEAARRKMNKLLKALRKETREVELLERL